MGATILNFRRGIRYIAQLVFQALNVDSVLRAVRSPARQQKTGEALIRIGGGMNAPDMGALQPSSGDGSETRVYKRWRQIPVLVGHVQQGVHNHLINYFPIRRRKFVFCIVR